MDPSLRSNGSNTRPPTQSPVRAAGRSRLAGRVERVVNSALAGERAAVLNAGSAELLADPVGCSAVFESALDRPGMGVLGHFLTQELLRRSRLHDDLLNALASPRPATRAAAARICGAARLSESIVWIADLLQDASPPVQDAAVRSLSRLGGRRAGEQIKASAGGVPPYPPALPLSRAAPHLGLQA